MTPSKGGRRETSNNFPCRECGSYLHNTVDCPDCAPASGEAKAESTLEQCVEYLEALDLGRFAGPVWLEYRAAILAHLRAAPSVADAPAVTEAEISRLRSSNSELQANVEALRERIVHGCYVEKIPQFQQGGNQHEVLEDVTAADCEAWIRAHEHMRTALEIVVRLRTVPGYTSVNRRADDMAAIAKAALDDLARAALASGSPTTGEKS